MKHETKNETLKSYVSFFEMTDIQLLYNKKWNMKDKSKVLKTYGYKWDKLQFKSCESLTEFCNFAHGFEFWVLFFLFCFAFGLH